MPLALAARADLPAAARAGLAGASVDGARARAEAVARRQRHLLARERDGREHGLLGGLTDRLPGVGARGEAGLRLPDVADPGDRALVDQGVAEGARRVILANRADQQRLVEALAEDVLPERRELGVAAAARERDQLEQRAVELHDLASARLDHEPGPPRRARPALARLADRPGAAHAQVRVEHEVALEVEQQVLAARLHRRHGAPGEALRPAVALVAPLGRADRVGHAPLQHRPDAVGGVVDRVALGHARNDRRAARSGAQRQPPRPAAEAELDEQLLVGAAEHAGAVDPLDLELADASAAHGVGERRQRDPQRLA